MCWNRERKTRPLTRQMQGEPLKSMTGKGGLLHIPVLFSFCREVKCTFLVVVEGAVKLLLHIKGFF